ncbi:hypothetical protein K1719_008901 [Acacia pycnantha]|nr:hypothetical protein K1719_008901 [Acacia pycnantha]
MGSKRINLNNYPICPYPDLTIAIGHHFNFSTIIVLLQDEIDGLCVQSNDGGWQALDSCAADVQVDGDQHQCCLADNE